MPSFVIFHLDIGVVRVGKVEMVAIVLCPGERGCRIEISAAQVKFELRIDDEGGTEGFQQIGISPGR